MIDDQTCETCRFWLWRNQINWYPNAMYDCDREWEPPIRGNVEEKGCCRYYPPDIDKGHPETMRHAWCGHWRSNNGNLSLLDNALEIDHYWMSKLPSVHGETRVLATIDGPKYENEG